jgi:hypothetical protein
MNEPQRLSEVGADDFECDLLRSARQDAPRPAAMRRTLAAIGVGMSLPLGVVTVAEGAIVPVKLGAVVLTKWLATGVALGVATAGGAKLTERALEPPRAAVVAPADAPRAAPPRAPRPATSAASAMPPMAAAVPPVPVATVTAAPVGDTARAVVPGAPSSLPEEVRSVDAAREALAQGDARGSLALLRRYEATFGSGALLPEARVLEVKALVALGERTRAVAAAKRIIDANPQSPHAEAVRAVVAGASFP